MGPLYLFLGWIKGNKTWKTRWHEYFGRVFLRENKLMCGLCSLEVPHVWEGCLEGKPLISDGSVFLLGTPFWVVCFGRVFKGDQLSIWVCFSLCFRLEPLSGLDQKQTKMKTHVRVMGLPLEDWLRSLRFLGLGWSSILVSFWELVPTVCQGQPKENRDPFWGVQYTKRPHGFLGTST